MNIKRNVSLSPLSTFKIGGRAEMFCLVRTPENLIRAAEWAKANKIPYRVFAGGSNTVFPDGTLNGLLIRIRGGKISVSRNTICADAGVLLKDAVRISLAHGLQGLETLSGIPGTIGGAAYGNAGAYGHSISEVIRRVEVWDGRTRRWISRKECAFGYRESILKHTPWLALRVELGLKKGDRKELFAVSRKTIRVRNKKYKPGIKCPGSFFKNVLVADTPKAALKKIDPRKIIAGKIPTGYLLEEVGAKGMRSGGIAIPAFHGNLFENTGGATARDVKQLAATLKKRVYKKFGITIEEEVRYF